MVFIGRKRRHAFHYPDNGNAQRIENRHKQNTQRYRRSRFYGPHFNKLNGKNGNDEAANQRTGIAHKNGGLVKIITQKTQHTAYQTKRYHGIIPEFIAAELVKIETQRCRNYGYNGTSQAV